MKLKPGHYNQQYKIIDTNIIDILTGVVELAMSMGYMEYINNMRYSKPHLKNQLRNVFLSLETSIEEIEEAIEDIRRIDDKESIKGLDSRTMIDELHKMHLKLIDFKHKIDLLIEKEEL